jgi:cytochrome c-type biogenesis protein CcmH/NrfG
MRVKNRFPVVCSALVLIASTSCTVSPKAKEAKYLKRGQAQMAKKDYERAALEFRTAAQAMPSDAEPFYQLGLAYLQGSNPAGAVAAFRQATQLNPALSFRRFWHRHPTTWKPSTLWR